MKSPLIRFYNHNFIPNNLIKSFSKISIFLYTEDVRLRKILSMFSFLAVLYPPNVLSIQTLYRMSKIKHKKATSNQPKIVAFKHRAEDRINKYKESSQNICAVA